MNWKRLIKFCLTRPFCAIKSIYFNFHYLPFSQAKHMPIFLYKTHLRKVKGCVKIETEEITTGMISLGKYIAGIYPNSGCVWENGGKIIFKGRCRVGNDCAISVGKHGTLEIGHDFVTNAATKIVCSNHIIFGEHTRLGWDNLIMDTYFHRTKKIDGSFNGKGYGQIVTGNHFWSGVKCIIFPGAKTPDYCIAAAGSFINKDLSNLPTHIMIAGSPAKLKVEGVWKDVNDDKTIEF